MKIWLDLDWDHSSFKIPTGCDFSQPIGLMNADLKLNRLLQQA